MTISRQNTLAMKHGEATFADSLPDSYFADDGVNWSLPEITQVGKSHTVFNRETKRFDTYINLSGPKDSTTLKDLEEYAPGYKVCDGTEMVITDPDDDSRFIWTLRFADYDGGSHAPKPDDLAESGQRRARSADALADMIQGGKP